MLLKAVTSLLAECGKGSLSCSHYFTVIAPRLANQDSLPITSVFAIARAKSSSRASSA